MFYCNSHATGEADRLDQGQLSRLHMILKPFMLRRVKKDVENELGDKVRRTWAKQRQGWGWGEAGLGLAGVRLGGAGRRCAWAGCATRL